MIQTLISPSHSVKAAILIFTSNFVIILLILKLLYRFFQSHGQQLCKLLGIKESFNM